MRHKIFKRGGYTVGVISVNGGESIAPVTLSRDPILDNEATTKGYVDELSNNINVNSITSGILSPLRIPGFSGDLIKLEGSNITTIKNSGVVPSTYPKVTVNGKGIVTGGSGLVEGDIPSLPWSKITSGLPTTLSGYGITDALPLSGGVMTGTLKVGTVGVSPGSIINKEYVDNLAVSVSGINVGGIVYKLTDVTPSGYLKANGGHVSKTTYANLYAVIGDKFTGGLQTPGNGKPWVNQYLFNNEQDTDIVDWVETTNLPEPISDPNVIVTKNRVYLLGGIGLDGGGNSKTISTVYTAPINLDGSLGEWVIDAPLPAPFARSQAIVTKNRVYLLGGWSGGTVVSTVYTATINSDGTLGGWEIGASLPDPLYASTSVITKDRVYLVGGINATETVNKVYTAPINPDGTLGTWVTSYNLPTNYSYGQLIATKNRLYLAWSSTSNTYTTTLSSSGTISTWSMVTSPPIQLSASQAVVSKNRIYILGGYTGGVAKSTVYSAPINADGTLGTWEVGTSLPGPLARSQAVVTKSKIYLIGGTIGGTNDVPTSVVYVASFKGGSNDYSPYYDGTVLPLTGSTYFRLPDIKSRFQGATAYIRY